MKQSTLVLIVSAIVVAVVAGIVGAAYLINRSSAPSATTPVATAPAEIASVLIRPDSHVLDQGPDGAVTVVEFLDFECEACGAFYPIVEDLRATYAGEITYVVRYLPLPGHANAMTAALAAEAAAQQGAFEDMYHLLFERQGEWGEVGEPRPEVFRGFAEELGLDLAAYDAAIADPATQARVEADLADATALGLTGTPSFFVDGEPVALAYLDDLQAAIDAALSAR